MTDYTIRPLNLWETALLEEFLYESIFQPPGTPLLPKEVVKEPELRIYFEHFGKKDDHCLVAEHQGNVVGAVWTRILAGPTRGYGNVDDATPEFAISLYPEFRNQGMGRALMKAMLSLLKEKGYKQASLSVQKGNVYAVRLYRSLGFQVFFEAEEEYVLVCQLNK